MGLFDDLLPARQQEERLSSLFSPTSKFFAGSQQASVASGARKRQLPSEQSQPGVQPSKRSKKTLAAQCAQERDAEQQPTADHTGKKARKVKHQALAEVSATQPNSQEGRMHDGKAAATLVGSTSGLQPAGGLSARKQKKHSKKRHAKERGAGADQSAAAASGQQRAAQAGVQQLQKADAKRPRPPGSPDSPGSGQAEPAQPAKRAKASAGKQLGADGNAASASVVSLH